MFPWSVKCKVDNGPPPLSGIPIRTPHSICESIKELRLRVVVTAKVNFDVARRIPAEYYRSISIILRPFVVRHFVLSAQFSWVSSSSAVSVIATSLGYGRTLRHPYNKTNVIIWPLSYLRLGPCCSLHKRPYLYVFPRRV